MPNKPADINDPLRGKKSGKWTKYGGAIHGLIKEEPEDVWYCQCCGRKVPKEIPAFLFEMFTDDFIRICNVCMNLKSRRKVVDIRYLIKIERKTH